MKVGMISPLTGEDAGKTFLLKNLSVFEGGRSRGNHVLLGDPTVAMSHFRICRTNDEYVIYDQGAKNGIFVNGERIEKMVLADGDSVRAGGVEMKFEMVDENTPGRVASSAPEFGSRDQPVGVAVSDAPRPVPSSPRSTTSAPPDSSPSPAPARRSESPVAEVPSGASDGGVPGSSMEVVEGDDKGRIYMLSATDGFVIGRGSTADLRLRDSKVSRAHCAVTLLGEHYIVQDNGSSNGTVVNGEKINKTVLRDGDYIRLGFTILRFRSTACVEV